MKKLKTIKIATELSYVFGLWPSTFLSEFCLNS